MSTRKRNPRAPTMSLQEAIKYGNLVYDIAGLHVIPIDAAAEALGYKDSRSGAAQVRLATLKQYGILHKHGKSEIAVSEDIQTIRFSPALDEQYSAANTLFRTPSIFSDILEKYNDSPPDDSVIRFDLIGLGFNREGADLVLKCFRESYDYISNISIDQTPQSSDHDVDVQEDVTTQPQGDEKGGVNPVDAVLSQVGYENMLIRLPNKRKAMLSIPDDFNAKDKSALISQVSAIWIEDDTN